MKQNAPTLVYQCQVELLLGLILLTREKYWVTLCKAITSVYSILSVQAPMFSVLKVRVP